MSDDSEQRRVRDRALVERILAGEARAFEDLIECQQERVFRVLSLMGVPPQDREDVAQEVFLKIFRHLKGFRPAARLDSWIYKIVVNAALDYRRNRKSGDILESIEDHPIRSTLSTGADLAVSADRQLRNALTTLTSRERTVFVLLEIEGLPVREVARVMRITRVTVRRHLSLARKRLEKKIQLH